MSYLGAGEEGRECDERRGEGKWGRDALDSCRVGFLWTSVGELCRLGQGIHGSV